MADDAGNGRDWGGEGWGERWEDDVAPRPQPPAPPAGPEYQGELGYGLDETPGDKGTPWPARALMLAGVLLVVAGLAFAIVRGLDDDGDGGGEGDDPSELATDDEDDDRSTTSSTRSTSTSSTSSTVADGETSAPTAPTASSTTSTTRRGSGGSSSGGGSTTTTTRKPGFVTATTQPDAPKELACSEGGGGSAVPPGDGWQLYWLTEPEPNDPATLDFCVVDVTVKVGVPVEVYMVAQDPDAVFFKDDPCVARVGWQGTLDVCRGVQAAPAQPGTTPDESFGYLKSEKFTFTYDSPGQKTIVARVWSGRPGSPYASTAVAVLTVDVRA